MCALDHIVTYVCLEYIVTYVVLEYIVTYVCFKVYSYMYALEYIVT